jgi:L-histidine Nalpha-methyltransferase
MNTFYQEVIEGLSRPLKRISSKYFYDDKGDELFREIMDLEEYYLPRCEREILASHGADISDTLSQFGPKWDIVELGAGDGSKTVELLRQLTEDGICGTYIAMDISPYVLKLNQELIEKQIPDIAYEAIPGDYFETMDQLKAHKKPKVFLFLGSNIGNFSPKKVKTFMEQVGGVMRAGDKFVVAFDLKKNPIVIRRAYNDSKGVTRRFNLNVLTRINRELGSNFDVDAFDHYPAYDPIKGVASSYLVCLKPHTVTFPGGENFEFKRDELIHTEISKKYKFDEIGALAADNHFSVVRHFTDDREYYSLSMLHFENSIQDK